MIDRILPRLLLLSALVSSCGSSPAGHESTKAPEAGAARDGGSADEGPTAADCERWWSAFLAQDERWPEYREQWLSGGAVARDLLLSFLLKSIWTDNSAEEGPDRPDPLWKRCGRELRYFGSDAVRPLQQSVRVLVERDRVDHVSVDRMLRILGEVADASEVASLLSGAKEPLRRATTKALAQMQQPEAVDPLCRLVREDADWQVRSAAVDGLAVWARRTGSGEPSAFSRDALVDALQDEDRYVRNKACAALSRVRVRGVQDALVDGLERANQRGDKEFAAVLHDALKTNTHQLSVPQDVEAWRRALRAGDG